MSSLYDDYEFAALCDRFPVWWEPLRRIHPTLHGERVVPHQRSSPDAPEAGRKHHPDWAFKALEGGKVREYKVERKSRKPGTPRTDILVERYMFYVDGPDAYDPEKYILGWYYNTMADYVQYLWTSSQPPVGGLGVGYQPAQLLTLRWKAFEAAFPQAYVESLPIRTNKELNRGRRGHHYQVAWSTITLDEVLDRLPNDAWLDKDLAV